MTLPKIRFKSLGPRKKTSVWNSRKLKIISLTHTQKKNTKFWMLNLWSNLELTLLLKKEPTSISHLVYIRWQSLNGSRLWPLMENIFFLSNVLMRKCWVLIMASSCWWPILRFIFVVRFNLVCLYLTELMKCAKVEVFDWFGSRDDISTAWLKKHWLNKNMFSYPMH